MNTARRVTGAFPVLLVTTAFILLVSLGFWQLRRADENRVLYQHYEAQSSLEPYSLSGYNRAANAQDLEWRRATVTGRYIRGYVYLLDNRIENGQAGYHVYSLFLPDGLSECVLVNRGWVEAGAYRDRVPDISTPRGELTLIGELVEFPAPRLEEDFDEGFANGVVRVQELNITRIEADTGYTLLPYIVRLQPPSPSSFSLNWDRPGNEGRRNIGYAVQWFLLAAALLILYFSLVMRQKPPKNGR